ESSLLSCLFSGCQAANDPHTPLRAQARYVAFLQENPSAMGFIEGASFTRLRELAVVFNAPPSIAHVIRARNATVTLSARNLALWTSFRGLDPEEAGAEQMPG